MTRYLTFSENLKGTFFIVLSACLYGLLGYFGMRLLAYHHAVDNLLFWRFFISGCWMCFFCLLKKDFNFVANFSMFRIMSISALFYCVSALFYFLTSEQIGTGLAMVIFFSYPLFIVLFNVFLGKKPLNKITMSITLVLLVGIFCIKGSGETALTLKGLSLGMIASLGYAGYIYFNKAFAPMISPHHSTLLVSYLCAFLLFCSLTVNHHFHLPHSWQEWGFHLAFGILATALPIQLFLVGLNYLSSFKAAMLSVFEPLVTLFIGYFVLHESLSGLQIIGVAILLSSVLLIQFDREQPQGISHAHS